MDRLLGSQGNDRGYGGRDASRSSLPWIGYGRYDDGGHLRERAGEDLKKVGCD